MKYFKYRNINKVQQLANKQRLASLGKDEKKKAKRSERLTKVVSFCGIIFFFCCFGMFIFFIKLIPVPKNTFLIILYGIGCVILGLIALIISAISTLIPFGILLDKVRYNLPEMRKEFIKKASEPIRKYYGLSDEYLITKCFESTNTLFNDHDICIFRYGNEIRITTDIVNGFINANCDLGCYLVKLEELELYKDNYQNKRVTVLNFAGEKFIVGIKAYTYIKQLMDTKIYKYLFKSIEINNESISFIKHKKTVKIDFKNIKKVDITIPKYNGIPGSGYDYTYMFKVFSSQSKTIIFNIVLEREEEREIVELLNKKSINLTIKYFDNRPEGD